jgi:hypothetical protein
MLPHRAEQPVLKIPHPGLRTGRPGRPGICNAGVHATVSFFVFQNATKTGDGGFPLHALAAPPRGPGRTARSLKRPASGNTPTAPKLYAYMPRHSGNIRYIQIHTGIRYL